jgi:OpgC protein
LCGLCLGWHREDLTARVPRGLRSRLLITSAIIAGAALILAHAGTLGARGLEAWLRIGENAGGFAAKATLGPLIIVDFAALFVLGEAAVGGLMRRSWALVPLGWLEVVGRKSLRCYVAITIMAIVVSTMPHATWMALRDILVLVGVVLVHRVARIDPGARWSRQAISAPSAPA